MSLPITEDVCFLTFRAMAQGKRMVNYPRAQRTWNLDEQSDRDDLRDFALLALRQVALRLYYGNLSVVQLRYLEEKLR